jgi:hypothetical protein
MSSVFWFVRVYLCCVRRLSSRRSKPAFHVLMSRALGSPAVDEAEERCEGAIEGVRVGVALYVDILVDARLPVDCGFFALGEVCASDDMLGWCAVVRCAVCDIVLWVQCSVYGVLVGSRERR